MKNRLKTVKKYKQNTKPKEEDVETSIPSTTPIGNSSTTISITDNQSEDGKDEPDPMIEYILQEIEKNKDKQIQDAQMDYAYRQQQANKIVADIEDYIKKNQTK